VKKPPPALPSNALPMVDLETGIVTEPWYGFFSDLTGKATPFQQIEFPPPVPPSPFVFAFTAIHAGNALIKGGTVSSVGLQRARVIISPIGPVAGFFPMSQNDVLIITYTVLPVLWYLPNGNPS
jgi:hypothetical protein